MLGSITTHFCNSRDLNFRNILRANGNMDYAVKSHNKVKMIGN